MTRIAFFAQLGFHEPVLRPVADELRRRGREGTGVDVLLTANTGDVRRFQPDVLLMASVERLEYWRHHLPDACIGSLRHGIGGSKRVAARLPDRSSARRLDFVCAGERSVLERFIRTSTEPAVTWFTGYPPLDPLFRQGRDSRAVETSPSPSRKRTVLYAPTWNLGLSSAPMLGGDLTGSIRGNDSSVRIVIKPHPVIPHWRPEWMRAWRSAATTNVNVTLVEDADADVVPHLLDADLLITDASSVALSFLALDRPIVWVTSPRAIADPAYDADDLLWKRRDIGDEVTSVGDLPRVVAEALREPDRRGPQRRDVAASLFEGWDDGNSTARVVDRLLELAAIPKGERPHLAATSVRPPEPWWRIHDMRVVARNQPTVRRLVLGRLEGARLRSREQTMERAAHRAATVKAGERPR